MHEQITEKESIIEIRQARKEDLALISAVDRESFGLGSGYNILTLRQLMDTAPEFFLVADAGQRIVGYVAGLPSTTPGKAWVISAAVSHTARRSNIAKKLCFKLYQTLVQHRFGEVFLTVRPDNLPILRIAKTFQMQIVREEPDYFGPGETRLVLSTKI